DVGQQYAAWWYEQAASEEQRDQAHLLSGGGLPHEVDRPLLQFACQMLNEFTLTEAQRVRLRDGFHEGIRTVLLKQRCVRRGSRYRLRRAADRGRGRPGPVARGARGARGDLGDLPASTERRRASVGVRRRPGARVGTSACSPAGVSTPSVGRTRRRVLASAPRGRRAVWSG